MADGEQVTGRHDYSDMEWTSFDRFGRYSRVADLVSCEAEAGPIVDVGDRSGYLTRFLPSCRSVAFDMEVENDRFDDSVVGVADGIRLPLADDAAAAVVSCDVLEHLPDDARPAFLRELVRVARNRIVLTAPFDTVGVAATESLVARFALVAHHLDQPQLAEHAERGLPDLVEATTVLTEAGWDVRVEGEGNLVDWLGLMLLRLGSEANPELRPVGDGLDGLYNSLFPGRAVMPPFYRHILIATPGTGVVEGLEEALNPPTWSTDAIGGALLAQLNLSALLPRLRLLEEQVSDIVAGHLVNVVGRTDQQNLEVMESLRAIDARLTEVDRRSIRATVRRVWRRLRSSSSLPS